MLPPVARIVQEHAGESAILRNTRSTLVRAPHVKLHHLRRLDDRLAAHLDGLAVAGGHGRKACEAALEDAGTGSVFAAAVRAIEDRSWADLGKLYALAEAVPEARRGLISAYGWQSAGALQGTVKRSLDSRSAFARQVGIAACALHGADPGAALDAEVGSPQQSLRARALRCAGEIGRRDLTQPCLDHLRDEDAECRFHAARSAALLGARGGDVRVLAEIAAQAGPFRMAALALALPSSDHGAARALVERVAAERDDIRALIRAVACAGDPRYVPWLMKFMADDKLARVAGEAFSFVTGADLAWLDLERKPPERVEAGPNDNPSDGDVAMDEDDGLPFPDAEKVQTWWAANAAQFQPGTRYFVGAPPNWEHCVHVLKEGYQRQRIAAAQYLCLLRPGTVLFNCAAPAWRQQRLLATMQ